MHSPSRRVTGPVVPHVSPHILPTLQPLRGQSFLPRHGEDRVLEQHAPRPPRHAQVADALARVMLVVVMRTREGTHDVQAPAGRSQRRTKRRRTAPERLLLTFTCTINICASAEPSRLRRLRKVPPQAGQRSNAMGTQPPLDGSPQRFPAGPCACSATRGTGTGIARSIPLRQIARGAPPGKRTARPSRAGRGVWLTAADGSTLGMGTTSKVVRGAWGGATQPRRVWRAGNLPGHRYAADRGGWRGGLRRQRTQRCRG